MCTNERLAWVCLVSIAVVYIPYFSFLTYSIQTSNVPPPLGVVTIAFVGAIIAQIIITGIPAAIVGILDRKQVTDERDIAIRHKASTLAYVCLISCVLILVTGGSLLRPMFPLLGDGVFIGQLGLLCVVISELSNYGVQVVEYRRTT